ncbi:hypothetical protein D3C75_771840 [compost metagenome]
MPCRVSLQIAFWSIPPRHRLGSLSVTCGGRPEVIQHLIIVHRLYIPQKTVHGCSKFTFLVQTNLPAPKFSHLLGMIYDVSEFIHYLNFGHGL